MERIAFSMAFSCGRGLPFIATKLSPGASCVPYWVDTANRCRPWLRTSGLSTSTSPSPQARSASDSSGHRGRSRSKSAYTTIDGFCRQHVTTGWNRRYCCTDRFPTGKKMGAVRRKPPAIAFLRASLVQCIGIAESVAVESCLGSRLRMSWTCHLSVWDTFS